METGTQDNCPVQVMTWTTSVSDTLTRRLSMKMTFIAAALATTLIAAPAFADCAADLTKVEEAMKTMKLDEANSAKAKELMDKAVAARDAKDEAGCTASATELKTMVGLS
jgi:hypothetical protein